MATIMVVDDQEDIRFSIKMILSRAGYTVEEASSGDECLQKLSNTKVDLILLDIMMPGTPVKDIVSQISGTKIIYLTAVMNTEAEKSGILKQVNVVGFIQKPPQQDQLLAKIQSVLNHDA